MLEPYLRMDDFNYRAARNACGNVAGLLHWIQAMVTYYHVAQGVKPKMEHLRLAERNLKKANISLEAAQKELQVLVTKINFFTGGKALN